MVVHFNKRPRPICGLHDAIAFGPILHGLPAWLATSGGVTSPAVATEAAAAESTFGLRPRFVDRERTATHLILVEFGRGFLRFLVGCHFDERKPSRPTRGSVAHHANRFN